MGKHVLKMASSPDSVPVEERRRLQGRVRTRRYRDRQNEDARARRRQSDRDRRRAARQRATEARRRPQKPPEERSVRFAIATTLYQLRLQPSQHTWLTRSYSVVYVSTLHVSMREASLRMRMSSFKYLGVNFSTDLTWSYHINTICKKTRNLIGLLYRNFYQFSNPSTL